MASDIDICNLALGYLGDTAAVSSISPPEGSAQAQHCARFYPIARNILLEKQAWNFNTRRSALAQVTNPSSTWLFAYAKPSNVLKILAVLPEGAADDNEVIYVNPGTITTSTGYVETQVAQYLTPQPYTVETNSSGDQIILTNAENAVLRYTVQVTDSAKFSSLFVMALSYLLASMLAGPLIKGDAGAAEAKRCLALSQVYEMQAMSSDANQRRTDVKPVTPWISGR